MQKRIILGLFVGLLTVLCMSLYTYCNLKFNSVYYAQHIPHKEGTGRTLLCWWRIMAGFIHRRLIVFDTTMIEQTLL